jgi:hypothetical protein
MQAPRTDVVRLEGTVESALELRQAALIARDLLPTGEHRDALVALAVHLRYALEDMGVEVCD